MLSRFIQVGLVLSLSWCKLWQLSFRLLFSEFCSSRRRYASSIIFRRKSWEYIGDIKFSCSVNVFLFQFKGHRCGNTG